jgi:nicotinamidase-related amidase
MNTVTSPFTTATRMSWLSLALTGATTGAPIPAYPAPKTAVLAVDLQRDFLADDARMPIAAPQVDPLLRASNAVLDVAHQRGWRVVTIGNEFPPGDWLRNLIQHGAAIRGSRGAEIDPRVRRVSDAYFAKDRRDAFTNPALDAWLRAEQVNHLVVLGVMANACVRATALGARNRGYRVTLVRDAVGAPTDQVRDSVLASLARAGAEVVSADDLVRGSSAR